VGQENSKEKQRFPSKFGTSQLINRSVNYGQHPAEEKSERPKISQINNNIYSNISKMKEVKK